MNKNKNISPSRAVVCWLGLFAASCILLLASPTCHAQFQQNYQVADSGNQFPAHPTFDPNVRPADLIVQGTEESSVAPAAHQASPESLMDSTGAMFANLSSSVKQKWQQGDWGQRIGGYVQNINLSRMLASLALVLGGYFGLVWLSRRFFGNVSQVPSDVLEVLGQVPFGPKKQLQIVRLGSKLLLLIHGPEGTHPIGEITDPNEVEYLAALCTGKKTVSGAQALNIAKASISRNATASPTVNISSNPAPVAAPQAAGDAANTPNHLASILQSLNGNTGSAAVF